VLLLLVSEIASKTRKDATIIHLYQNGTNKEYNLLTKKVVLLPMYTNLFQSILLTKDILICFQRKIVFSIIDASYLGCNFLPTISKFASVYNKNWSEGLHAKRVH
jgi:hypothetical protein